MCAEFYLFGAMMVKESRHNWSFAKCLLPSDIQVHTELSRNKKEENIGIAIARQLDAVRKSEPDLWDSR